MTQFEIEKANDIAYFVDLFNRGQITKIQLNRNLRIIEVFYKAA